MMAMSQLGGRQLAGRLGKRWWRWCSSVEDSWLVVSVSGKYGGDVAARWKTAGWFSRERMVAMLQLGEIQPVGRREKDGGDVTARWKASGWSSGKDGGGVAARKAPPPQKKKHFYVQHHDLCA
jgi:hypothetical protein